MDIYKKEFEELLQEQIKSNKIDISIILYTFNIFIKLAPKGFQQNGSYASKKRLIAHN